MTKQQKTEVVRQVALTTEDNPFDPFDSPTEWSRYDTLKGYNTPAYLARVVVDSNELNETQRTIAIELAIDEIISLNLTGKYKKVVREINVSELFL